MYALPSFPRLAFAVANNFKGYERILCCHAIELVKIRRVTFGLAQIDDSITTSLLDVYVWRRVVVRVDLDHEPSFAP